MPNSGTKIHAASGAIYIGAPAGGGGTRIAAKAEWTLQRNRDYVDATVFGDTNKTYLAGLPNVQGTFAGFLDVSGDLLLSAATSQFQNIWLYASDGTGLVTTTYLVAHGPALMDANVTVNNTDAARITGEFRAQGAWTIDL